MKTYTEHKLTDAMLQRLSKIAHHRDFSGANSVDALVRRGLVTDVGPILATDAGRAALQQARREGW